MFKLKLNIKSFAVGIILGGVTFSSLGFAVNNYIIKENKFPIVINKVKSDVSALNIDGYTWLKLADVGIQLNSTVKFNETTSTIEIDSNNTNSAKTNNDTVGESSVIPSPVPSVSNGTIQKDGFYLYVQDGVEYILLRDIISKQHKENKEYNFKLITNTKINKTVNFVDLSNGNEDVVYENIPITIIQDSSCIQYNLYIDKLLPLIK